MKPRSIVSPRSATHSHSHIHTATATQPQPRSHSHTYVSASYTSLSFSPRLPPHNSSSAGINARRHTLPTPSTSSTLNSRATTGSLDAGSADASAASSSPVRNCCMHSQNDAREIRQPGRSSPWLNTSATSTTLHVVRYVRRRSSSSDGSASGVEASAAGLYHAMKASTGMAVQLA